MGDPMYVPLRRAAAAVGGGLASAALLVACSTPAPLTNGPVHLDIASVEDLSQGCENIRDGYPGAAKYAGDGPHTIVVFAKDLVTDTASLPDYQLANSDSPDDMRDMLDMPDSPREVELLACGETRPGDEQLNVCAYKSVLGGGPTEIPLYSQLYTFTIYELRTGRVVDTLKLESQMRLPASSCPVTLEGGGNKIYAKAQPFELDDLFKDTVNSPPA